MDTSTSSMPTGKARNDFVLVGKIVKLVGLKGMVRVITFSDNPDRFSPGATLSIRGKDREIDEISVLEAKPIPGKEALNILFENYETLERASELVGKELFVPRTDRKAHPDSFFPDEFPGMEVVSSDGKPEGTVISLVIDIPSPYLLIRTERNGELMVPFRKVYIAAVDMAERKVRLSMPIRVHIPEDS